ncbi:MAG: DNA polymerase III subunit delta [Spirochaetia bacterium]|nr:DNA polymerase III subunit delta [Spirochaetia bacterium]
MIKPSYLLTGPELGEKKAYIDSIRAEIKEKYGDEIEEYTFYPYDSDMSEAIGAAESLGMFSCFKLIFINDASELKKKDVELFLQYLKKPAQDAVLIFTDSGMKVDAKLKKAVGEEKVFWELKEPQMRSYIQNYFRKIGTPIDSDAAAFIASNCDPNTLSVKNECDKLALFFDSKEPITLEAIEEMLFNGKEENVFTLYDQLLVGTLEKATEIAKNLMMSSDGAPIQLLGGLIWQLRRMLGVRTLMDQGASPYEACLKNGVTTKRGQATHTSGARRYTTTDLEHIMALCARYDELFRSVRTEMQETLFPMFLYELMVKKGN